jgi:hypothetical protein
VHVPAFTSVTVVPETEHTPAVSEENVTDPPLVAVAETLKGGSLELLLLRAAKVIV